MANIYVMSPPGVDVHVMDEEQFVNASQERRLHSNNVLALLNPLVTSDI
ncbi:hypothetical protein [Sodalis sp.]